MISFVTQNSGLFLTLCMLIGNPMACGQRNAVPPSISSAMALLEEGKPLAAIAQIESGSVDGDMTIDMLATLYSFVDNWQKVNALRSRRSAQDDTVEGPQGAVPVPAIDSIVEIARDYLQYDGLIFISKTRPTHILPEYYVASSRKWDGDDVSTSSSNE